jgi:hypothetical protein
MFIEVIQGRVADATALRAAMDEWLRDLAPGTTGWLGSTSGVTEDGRFISLVRFESADLARANAARREQDAWWARTKALFSDEPTFRDSDDVLLDLYAEPGNAGFVQVMQGRVKDTARARQLMTENSDELHAFRPDVIGTVDIAYPDGGFTTAIYFTSEAEARAGETKEPPPNLRAQMEEVGTLMDGKPEFHDLRQPWLDGPA